MWRSTVFLENEDSDQSISEDDDLNGELPEDHISLGVPAEKKGEVQVLSQLDMLRDAHEVMHERTQTSLLQKRQADFCVEDDVEFPIFSENGEFTDPPRKASACNSDEEILSDNEVRENGMNSSKYFASEADNYLKMGPNFGGNRRDGVCAWLAANTEADAPINLNDNSDFTSFRPESAKSKRSCKGGQGKPKPKFSFRAQSSNDIFKDVSHVYEKHTSIKYNKTEGASEQLVAKRSILSIDDDPDCLASDSSDEDEDNHQIVELNMPESNRKTIADQFQEALGATSIKDKGQMYAVPRHTGFGLFGKLQRVMQSEKERDSYFLNRFQAEDEANSFDVKILSRSLEAKLTVCSCSSFDYDESSRRTDNPLNDIKGKVLMIIFSSRICGDVELEVGTMVRVHPPWKEVNVKGKEEGIILSTYFSHI